MQLAVDNVNPIYSVEGLQNLFVRTQSQRAQEDGAQELALAVDADIQRVLLVILKLHPRSAVRNDLAQEVGAVVRRLKEDARRAVQLRNNHALRAVHDKGAIRRHQRNIAEEHFLLLDVADRLGASLRVLVINGQADRDLQRRGERHAALFALLLVVLQLQAHRVAALVAEIRRVLVVVAALLAEHFAGKERVRDHHGAAMHACRTQVVQPFQVAALALPVADREIHEVQLRNAAEIGDGENGNEHRLQARVVALVGQLVHLQKPLIGTALHFNQVRNLGCSGNLGKIEPAANRALLVGHEVTP